MTLPELPLKVGQAIGALMQFAADDGAAECNEWSAITNSIRDELVAAIREWGASLQQQQEKSAVTSDSTQHPVQPLQVDPDGVLRFKPNAIVRFLLDAGPFDMNKLALMPWSDEDRCQFAQLIGYSLSGYSDLSYVSDAEYARAEASQ
jgi:hypothetical protein